MNYSNRDETNTISNHLFQGIGNPISLAKLIRDASIKPLSLSRIPPNLLVGIGAKKFAEEHGMPSVANQFLVSKSARYRFMQWYQDLIDAEATTNTTLCADGDSKITRLSQAGNALRPGMTLMGAPTPLGSVSASQTIRPLGDGSAGSREVKDEEPDVDMVDDTVGAIAIDLMGHIAAGSSSGGIGMKHVGRVGPAALVGIGTAVIPAAPDDEEGISVAAVTSGTGEHMATSFASHKCAERLYHSSRRGRGGQNIAEFDDDAVMESFISVDFMGHPGVKSQPTPGAIGVMAVKQTNSGYYFYFAHNTESFALASMASTESKPLCTMSRSGKNGGVIRGGRKIHIS